MKAQIIIEFSLMLAAIALFSLIIMQLINIKLGENIDEGNYIKLQQYAKNIQSEINLAYVSRSGYHRNFTVPSDIDSKSYSITIHGKFLVLNQTGKWVSVLIPKVNGSVHTGENMIVNENGKIKIN